VVFVLLAVCWSSCAAARVFKLCCSTCAAARVLKLCCSSRPAAAVCAKHFCSPHGWMRLKKLIEGQDATLVHTNACVQVIVAGARLGAVQGLQQARRLTATQLVVRVVGNECGEFVDVSGGPRDACEVGARHTGSQLRGFNSACLGMPSVLQAASFGAIKYTCGFGKQRERSIDYGPAAKGQA